MQMKKSANYLRAFIFLLLMAITGILNAQEAKQQVRKISGTVLDEKGESIIGASIFLKGDKTGTITNNDGNFSLEIPASNAVLIVSFLGYITREVPVGTQEVVNIRLSENNVALEEVVITALGIKRQEKSLGYSVQQIDGSIFEKIKTDNPIDQLNGKVAGLTINSRAGLLHEAKITLRGRTPLYVVNGVPIDSYKGISSDDIESISVLKGAQASVLYGTRGADGAIIITTKQAGKNKALNIKLNSSTMVTTGYLTMPEEQVIYGQGDLGKYAFKDGKGGGTNDGLWIWGPKLDRKDPTSPSGYWETPQYNSEKNPDGSLIPLPWRSYSDNFKNFLQTGFVTDNNLSISKTYEDGSFRVSLNQMYREGMVPNTELKRFGLTLSGQYDISKKFHVNANMIYSYMYSHNIPGTGYSNDLPYYNILIYMGANTDINDLKNYWKPGLERYAQRNFNYAWFNNPWFLAYEYERPYSEPELVASLSANYDVNSYLNILLRGATNSKQTRNEKHTPYAWISGDTGEYWMDNTGINLYDMDMIVNYKRIFGDFGIDAMGGGSWHEKAYRYLEAKTNGGLIMPDLYSLSNSKKTAIVGEYKMNKRMYGLYGSLTLSWKNALFLGFTGRNDWSSVFKKKNQSFFYPSFSMSAILTELIDFPKTVSYLKLRSSWAKVGRDMDSYQLNTVYEYQENNTWAGNPAYYASSRLIDENITPSFNTAVESGLDIRSIAQEDK
jgi:TonB-linked SusC/RagA family outer membrane protein